jgi:hypothetical protein
MILVMAIAAPWVIRQLGLPDAQPGSGPSSWLVSEGTSLSPAGWWYVLVSLPLVYFFLLIWAWRYAWWALFLGRLGTLDLQILPAHPDAMGGIAPLVRAQMSFVLVGLAINVILAGAIANEILPPWETSPWTTIS